MRDEKRVVVDRIFERTRDNVVLTIAAAFLDDPFTYGIPIQTSGGLVILHPFRNAFRDACQFAYVWLPLVGTFCMNSVEPLHLDKTPICKEIDGLMEDRGYEVTL
jgi:hypothetical protein